MATRARRKQDERGESRGTYHRDTTFTRLDILENYNSDGDGEEYDDDEPSLLFVDPESRTDKEARLGLLRSDPLLDWYEDEMANLIFVSLVAQILALVGFAIFFFIEATTLTFSGRSGVLGVSIAYFLFWLLLLCPHYAAELFYWLARRRSTYNSLSVDNCRRVWCIRITCIVLTTVTMILLWVMYGTDNGLKPLHDYDEHSVEAHGGDDGDLMLLHYPYRLTYPLAMLQLACAQLLMISTIFWNILGYDLGDEQEMTDAYLARYGPKHVK